MRGVRRLRGLIYALPEDSATARAIRPPKTAASEWSTTDELLAITAERVGSVGLLLIRLLAAKPPSMSSLPDVTIARPYDGAATSSPTSSSTPNTHHRPPRRQATSEELRRFMGNRVRYTPREG